MQFSFLRSRWCAVGLSIALCSQGAFSQGQAPPADGGAPATGAGSAGSTGAGSTPAPGFPGSNTNRPNQPTFPTDRQQQQQQQQQQFPEMQRPIFFSGKVMLEDGTPPSEQVTIERVCNGNPRPEAYTDSKGRFHFQLGQNTAMMADASVSGGADVFGSSPGSPRGMSGQQRGISERDLMGCELRASLAGYRSESVNLSGRRSMENPDVGTIILRRLANVEGLTFSASSAAAPKDAKKAFEKGRELERKKKFPEAQKELEKALAIYPKFANAWLELGKVMQAQNNQPEARKAYEEALKADSKLVEPYVQLAFFAAQEKNWKDSAAASQRALKLNPYDFPQAYFYNAVANLNLKDLDAAEKSAREGIKSDGGKRMPKMRHVLGIVLAQKNDVSGAMEQMKGYLSMIPENSPDVELVKGQILQLEKFAQAAPPKPTAADQ
ncbi:MAG TPA: tetratricopeptide repeat protein [Bryobacteraceae bacterium]|nr:tetratricopeptide repeat protein [Bryobacteraceae bacterium]